MPVRTVRAIKRNGCLELLDPVDLPEGKEVRVTLDVVVPAARAKDMPQLATWDLGVRTPLRREDLYDDLL